MSIQVRGPGYHAQRRKAVANRYQSQGDGAVALPQWAVDLVGKLSKEKKQTRCEYVCRLLEKAATAASAGVLAVLLGAMFAYHCF
jgi:hypothetical protein